mgnify:CR=1 FL=1
MMTWVVSGACRGLGKTHLCQRLAVVLPNAVCAKVGHNPPKSDKPDNYFTNVDDFLVFHHQLSAGIRHCVVESNVLARKGYGDVRIFLDAPAGTDNVREDARELAEVAHIPIGAQREADGWRQVLNERLQSQELAARVADILEDQRFFLWKEDRTPCP